MELKKEYDANLDIRKRITIRGAKPFSRYNVKEFESGIIVMEPRELKRLDDISENTLKMIYSSIRNLKKGKVSKPIKFNRKN